MVTGSLAPDLFPKSCYFPFGIFTTLPNFKHIILAFNWWQFHSTSNISNRCCSLSVMNKIKRSCFKFCWTYMCKCDRFSCLIIGMLSIQIVDMFAQKILYFCTWKTLLAEASLGAIVSTYYINFVVFIVLRLAFSCLPTAVCSCGLSDCHS